jgi:hypothetical protein
VKFNLKAPVYVAIAMGVGLIVLFGYFLNWELLISIRVVFLQWAVILAGFALLVGVINLIGVHWNKFRKQQPGGWYSLVVLLTLVITLGIVAYSGPTGAWSLWLYNYIQVPIETSLLAIMAVFLAYAAARLLARRMNTMTVVFLATALLVMFGLVSLPFIDLPIIVDLRLWITQVLAAAGVRGILLGVALGIVATGLRVLIGADRPYGG